jgi:hypothetical protein
LEAGQHFDLVKVTQRRRDGCRYGCLEIIAIDRREEAAGQSGRKLLNREKLESLCPRERRLSALAAPSKTVMDNDRSAHDGLRGF